MSDSIFEIREYLDSSGNAVNDELVDITKELEYFAKIGGDKMEAQEALDEEKLFVRELALMAEKAEENRKILLKSGKIDVESSSIAEVSQKVPGDDLDDIFDKLQLESQKSLSSAPIVIKKTTNSKTKSSSSGLGGGGWKAGFLSGASSTKKKVVATAKGTDVVVDGSLAASIPPITNVPPPAKLVPPPAPVEKLQQPKVIQPPVAPVESKKVAFSPQVLEKVPNPTGPPPVQEAPSSPDNIFSQKKHFLQRSTVTSGGMKPLPKIPKGETTNLAFSGNIMERVYVDERK